ncbi:MAG TPA: hypothetical protein HA276_04155 [Candidatus Poseidoniaceae archaeon]|nr:MAG: hypothetical protein CBD01_008025 [Euryarchaeota archaeon TMED141]HII19412.1 hypothetical protein [Candidatus Poseidoniaceae archaeon]HII96865.1 hypothetical protein [Candidatus Poseidoniaceae archaeon]|tara:strand:- start:2156 stop:2611 length:456 start_codon:yes stop_codon:yes gene_type:complete
MADVPRPLAFGALSLALLLGPGLVLLLANGPAPEREAMWMGLANDMFVGFIVASAVMIMLLLAYGDSRDRPAAPILGLLMLLFFGFTLGLWLLQVSNLIGDASSPLARFFSELVHLAPVGLGLVLAGLVSLLVAGLGLRTFALEESERPRS